MGFKKHYFKVAGLIFAILFVIAIIALNLIRVDKVIIEPGTAETVRDKIEVDGARVYEPNGDIRFLTVLVSARKPSMMEYWYAKYVSKDSSIFPWEEINGEQSPQESQKLNEALMKGSQNAAKVVALTELNCDVNQSGSGALISAIEKRSPASKFLEVGDTITEINGKKIELDSQASDAIQSNSPGDTIELKIERSDKNVEKSFEIQLDSSPYEKGKAFLGVGLVTRDLDFDFPIDISINPGDVTGPSAGLAFALTSIDLLSKGDLSGSNRVAITGEIYLDGEVGQVGGVKEKAIAARRAGAKIMIVPKGEGGIARKNAGDMKVYEVSNISDALQVLEKSGGDPLSQMQSCPTS